MGKRDVAALALTTSETLRHLVEMLILKHERTVLETMIELKAQERASAEELAVLRDSAKDVLALIEKHSKLRDSHAVARLYAALALTATKNG